MNGVVPSGPPYITDVVSRRYGKLSDDSVNVALVSAEITYMSAV
jgi:hypothetical protein